MKKVKILSLVLALCLSLTLIVACGDNGDDGDNGEGLWENAIYKQSCELGEGDTTVTVKVKAEGKEIAITLKTDKRYLGEALKEHDLIQGEDGLYTLVNGIEADWNKDKTYWALYINGEYASSGADTTELVNGYEYEWSKEG
ncbi:MAG: DUF4430 domain-containing protein [Clostridia bacterium]|nr:DUF4430 domain-containing protein [Clostridia bacterium]